MASPRSQSGFFVHSTLETQKDLSSNWTTSELTLLQSQREPLKTSLQRFLLERLSELVTEMSVAPREEALYVRERWLEVGSLFNNVEQWLEEKEKEHGTL